jgi:hypothetical protein
MSTIVRFSMVLVLLLSACSIKRVKPVKFVNTEERFIHSKKTGIDYKLSVSLPKGYSSSRSTVRWTLTLFGELLANLIL